MKDNHVGSVLVVDHHRRLVGIVTDRDLALALARPHFDPCVTPIADVMTDVVGTCEEGARHADVLCTMKQYACRRVPVTHQGRPVALVTLDDLLVEGWAKISDLREIVAAQLGMPARHKPAGSIRPGPPGDAEGHEGAQRRHDARIEHAWREVVRDLDERAGLGSREAAETALRIVARMICRKLHPDDARGLAAALPAFLREDVSADAEGPAEPITVDAIGDELHRRLDLPLDAAVDILISVCDTVAEIGAPGDGAPGGRLRWYLRELFPRRGRRPGPA